MRSDIAYDWPLYAHAGIKPITAASRSWLMTELA